MLFAVDKKARFYVLTTFLTTAMYHFATNEPQSYVLGGDSTLYIVTLGIEYYPAQDSLCFEPETGKVETVPMNNFEMVYISVFM